MALQAVYRAAPGKAGLLEAAVTAGVAQGSAPAAVPVEERPAIRAVIEEPDPYRQLRLYAHTSRASGHGWDHCACEAAAAFEPDLRRLQQDQDTHRHAGPTRFARLLAERGALRTGLTPERAADIIVTLASRQPATRPPRLAFTFRACHPSPPRGIRS